MIERNKNMRQVYLIGTIVAIIAILVPTTISAFPKNIYVSPNQSDDWYDTLHVHTINEAMDVANNGDTIHVWTGVYVEDVYINKQISIIGNGIGQSIVIGSSSKYGVFEVSSSNVDISGFTITGGKDMGIYVYAPNAMIHDNTICNNNYTGIELNGEMAVGCVIENNNINNNQGRGIYLKYGANNNVITNNVIENTNGYGIQIKYSDGNTITYNSLIHCDVVGILLVDVDGLAPSGNTFSGCPVNIEVH